VIFLFDPELFILFQKGIIWS